MKNVKQPADEWKRIENRLKEQWVIENTDNSLHWEDVRESVKFGWIESRSKEWHPESIH